MSVESVYDQDSKPYRNYTNTTKQEYMAQSFTTIILSNFNRNFLRYSESLTQNDIHNFSCFSILLFSFSLDCQEVTMAKWW